MLISLCAKKSKDSSKPLHTTSQATGQKEPYIPYPTSYQPRDPAPHNLRHCQRIPQAFQLTLNLDWMATPHCSATNCAQIQFSGSGHLIQSKRMMITGSPPLGKQLLHVLFYLEPPVSGGSNFTYTLLMESQASAICTISGTPPPSFRGSIFVQ